MKRLLLLLVPLIVVMAHMTIEWLWFEQFDWQSVLLTQWLLQVISAGVAVLVLWLAQRWRLSSLNLDDGSEPDATSIAVKGWRFSLVLAVSSLGLVATTVALVLLSIQSWQGGNLPWHLAPGLLAMAALALSLRRLRPWLWWVSCMALVWISARAWSVWSLALVIPDSKIQDPVLGADLSFALGRFEGVRQLLVLLLLLQVAVLCSVVSERLLRRSVLSAWQLKLRPRARQRLQQGLGALFVTTGLWVWLMRHPVLWLQHGVVAGAGWLQVHLSLPLRSGVAIALIALGVMVTVVTSPSRLRRLPQVVTVVAVVIVLMEGLITPTIRWLMVNPQELRLEEPYIAEAIKGTRRAFQLDHIERQTFVPAPKLTPDDLQEGANTIANVRLWDSAPLLETNRQLQQLRVYYHFNHAVVDRYPLQPDQSTAQQVILSARELDQSRLPPRSRTWQNRHFVFTHGYGFTLSPVNDKADDGLPTYFIKNLGSDIRIQGNVPLSVDQEDVRDAVPVERASLYFGMLKTPYAITGAGVDEFDYPDGDENVFSRYAGQAGIRLTTPWHRLAAAIDLHEPRLLTTHSINSESRLLKRRELNDRIHALAPFIQSRGEPYLVSVPLPSGTAGYEPDQNQYWIVEGYTHSANYPYSAETGGDENDRYLRNAIKIVVDAYNGSMHFYVNEPEDPLIQGWMQLFPDLFESRDAMPAVLQGHLRVPEELFNVQVHQLQRYHVTDPRSFYSGDDIWEVPMETYGREQVPVVPYHVTAQVEDNESSEFLLLQPLTPQARPNLNAWLAARNDGDHYGELLQMEFPRDRPILGPEQVQALINQDPEISQQFGLWDRGGSEVIQGNLLVLPIGKSLLYVEPVYLRASKSGLPSLQRIVVSDGKSTAMAASLTDAIGALIKKNPA